MADVKISELAAMAAPEAADLLVMVDTSDATMGAGGTNKRTTFAQLVAAIGLPADLSAEVDALGAALALKAPLASPAFSGTVTVGTLDGLVKGSAGALAAAVAGTDYLAPAGDGSALGGIRAGQVGHLRPSAFSWFPYRVSPSPTTGLPTVYNADGTAFDVAALKPAGTKTYYVSNAASNGYAAGSDSNAGTSKSAPYASVTKALQQADVDVVMINPSTYYRAGGAHVAPTRSVQVIGDGGMAILSGSPGLTWTLAGGGATNTYQATRSSVAWVWDAGVLDSNGDHTRLTNDTGYSGTGNLTSAGSWYSNGTTLWVRTPDSRSLVGSLTIRPYLQEDVGIVTGALTVYLENLRIEGGRGFVGLSTGTAVKPTVYAKACEFKYQSNSSINGGFYMRGGTSILQGCTAALSASDGFNYHIETLATSFAVEIDCIGRDNGWGGGDNDNGSTTHDGNAIVRVNGQYYRNAGPNVVDVDASTTSWNVGCGAWGSTAATSGIQNGNYQSQCSGAGGMWLDACWGSVDPSVATKYQVVATSAGNLFFRSFSGAMPFYGAAGSSIRPY